LDRADWLREYIKSCSASLEEANASASSVEEANACSCAFQ
jgi:hypothetical protein